MQTYTRKKAARLLLQPPQKSMFNPKIKINLTLNHLSIFSKRNNAALIKC